MIHPRPVGGLERGLTAVVGRIAALRTGRRLLHPRGAVFDAVLVVPRRGDDERYDVPLLDRSAEYRAVVRLSKSVSTPGGLPDVLGFAVRVHVDAAAPLDLALASTGSRPGLRHLLMPHRDFATATFGSLLPYRVGGRRLLWAAASVSPERTLPADMATLPAEVEAARPVFRLMLASPTGPWQTVATLAVTGPRVGDAPDFDVEEHTVPGIRPDGWINRLRGPVYRASQAARRP